MKARLLASGSLLVVLAVVAVVLAWNRATSDDVPFSSLGGMYETYRIPLKSMHDVMDLGVVDANGDGLMDIFTSNHNYRQRLLISDGKGGYGDVLTAWGLDQTPEFPGVEIATRLPELGAPGVYVYWKARKTLAIRAHRMGEAGRLAGTLRTYTHVTPHADKAFAVELTAQPQGGEGGLGETALRFSAESDGEMALEMASPGVPASVVLDGTVPLNSVFVGSQKVSPRSSRFDLVLQDRHAMSWSDLNGDGRKDVFSTRGAIGGTLRKYPESVRRHISDELLLSQSDGRHRNVYAELGFEKRGCSGRKAAWVDFDGDGRLDVFVNCQERGKVAGSYPKQLYRQGADGRFVDVAAQVGLSIAGHEIVDFVWFDADGDGRPDLLTSEESGFILYRNQGGSFEHRALGRGKFVRADVPAIKGTTDEYWVFDGKLAVADFNGDGRPDVFSTSKRGNTLLVNNGDGHFAVVDPEAVGLPAASVASAWVDHDDDGRVDLYVVPQGIYRQGAGGRFEATGVLALPAHRYMAAIVNWADLDNDGRRDLIVAVNDNPSLWAWWERPFKMAEDKFEWRIAAVRRTGGSNHWLQVRLEGQPGNREAIGARVAVTTAEGLGMQDVGINEGSVFSQGHYLMYFGLGSHAVASTVTIRWPDGRMQELRDVSADRMLVVRQAGAIRSGR
ncbi:MAG TPA: hypothetical protein DHV08_07865 [Rhodocyclaceae bacterium]|nr:hypothetical protein [Rhodocyclaceae bacterium]